MTTKDELVKFLTEDNGFTPNEKWVVKMQYQHTTQPSNFEVRLWELICVCDAQNIEKLKLAFPDQVNGVLAWKYGNLAQRIRNHTNLDI